FFWIVLLIWTTYSAIRIVRNMLNSLNLKFMLNDLLIQNHRLVNTLSYSTIVFFNKDIYDELKNNIERLYQTFIHIIEKNVSGIYNEYYNKWNDTLIINIQGPENINITPYVPFDRLEKVN